MGADRGRRRGLWLGVLALGLALTTYCVGIRGAGQGAPVPGVARLSAVPPGLGQGGRPVPSDESLGYSRTIPPGRKAVRTGRTDHSAAELTVFAAASLTEAFQEIGEAFEQAHPGVRVRFSFAASSLLRAQIEQGAPANLFASADMAQMAPLVKAGKMRNAAPFARNRLVVAIPTANPGRVRRLQDLARSGLRLVITAPQVPIGRYTRQALAKMSGAGGLGRDFQRKVLANVVSQEPNVRALLTKVQLGEADAAIVYASDAVAAGAKVRAIAIPTRYNEIAVYPVGVVVGATNAGDAAAFARFLRSRSAQGVLKRHGFQVR